MDRRTDGQTDRGTDGQTHKNKSPQIPYIIFFFCIYMMGKEGDSTNPTKFLPLHFVKDIIRKKISLPGGFKMCPSVTATMLNNFWPNCQIEVKFSRSTKLFASNFWAGSLDPGDLKVMPGPRKVGFLPNLSFLGVLEQGGMSYLFVNGTTRQTKLWGRNLDFLRYGLIKSLKRCPFPGSLNKRWNLKV